MQTLAKEPWCSGVCATYGGSNYGMSQEITAIEQPAPLTEDPVDEDPEVADAIVRFLADRV